MSAKENFLHNLSIGLVVSGLMAISAAWVAGQTAPDIKISHAPASQPTVYVDDWSHHHLVFSNPGTDADALAKGRYEEWLKITNNPRYQLQQLKRGSPIRPLAPAATVAPEAAAESEDFLHRVGIALARPTPSPSPIGNPAKRPTIFGQPIKKDWSEELNAAGAVGTISGNNATSSSAVVINVTSLPSSPPTAAHQTGTFTSAPTNSVNAISVKVGANTLNLSSNGTQASSIGTFSGPALTNTSITLTSGANTLTMTPAGTGATAAGTFTAVPGVTSNSIVITNGTNTLTMTPAGTAGTVSGTFSTVPAQTNSNLTITNGGNVLTLNPGGTAQTAAATFTAFPITTTTSAITVTNGTKVLTMTPGGTAQNVTATFDGTAPSGALTTAITITSAGATTTLTPTGVGTATIPSEPSGSTTTTVGSITYTWHGTCPSGTDQCVVHTTSTTTDALNLAEAINNTCGSTSNCVVSGANGSATATSSGNVTTITNTTASTITFSDTSTATISPASGGITAPSTVACSGSGAAYSGKFVGSANPATEQTNLLGIIGSNCIPITAANGGTNAVKFTDAAPGLAANVGTMSDSGTVTNSITFGTVAVGTNGTATCTGSGPFTGTFVNSNVANTLATDFYDALVAGTCATGVGYSVPAPSAAIVTLTDLTPGAAATIGATFSGANGNGVTWTPGAGTDLATATCSGSAGVYTGTFKNGDVANTLASSFYAALNTGICAANVGYSPGNPGGSSPTVTLTDLAPGINFNGTGGTGVVTWTNTPGSVGTASCGGGVAPNYTGQYLNSNVANTLATNFYNAIILSSCPANVGFTTASPGAATVTLTNLIPNSAANTITGTGGAGVTWNNAAGTPGTASCSGTAPTFTGTFVNSATVGTLGLDFNTALNTGTCPASIGFTTTHTTGSASVTVTDTSLGTAAFGATNNTSIFSWSAASSGTNGSYGCSGSAPTFTATYASSSALPTLASNLSSAIGTCNAATMGVTSSYTSGNSFTINAATLGTGGNSGSTLTPTTGPFAWTTGALAGGTDGTTSASAWAYWSGSSELADSDVATNIAFTINNNTTTNAEVTASAVGSQVIITSLSAGAALPVGSTSYTALTWNPSTTAGGGQATVQPNTLPAKYGPSIYTADCTNDFVAYPTGITGSSTAASVVAYNNIYTSCSGSVPSESWAINTGGAVTTSPILSDDGTQMAWVQSSGTAASLVLVKWATGGTLLAPMSPTSQVSGSAYSGCTAAANTPCVYILPLAGPANDTYSAPFYDFSTDTIYVGDDGGKLHQFTGVFLGTPAETGSPWPVSLASAKLSSPVYEENSGNVFVGDFAGALHSVAGSSGSIIGTAAGIGDVIADGPLVDGNAGILFAFVTTSGSHAFTGDNAVYEFSTGFTAFGTPGVEALGTGGAGYYLYDGTFDNVYFQSTTNSGSIYVVGNTGTVGGGTLYRVAISNGGMTGVSSAVAGLNSTIHPWPSPASEFCNNGTSDCALSADETATTSGTDYIFFSVARGTPNGCTNATGNGCILSYIVNPPSTSGTGTVTNGSTLVTSLSTNLRSLGAGAVGYQIVGAGIPAGDTITAYSGTFLRFTMATAATASHTGEAITVTPSVPALSGTGLNVTNPATPGCWATSGMVIDNSDATSGASQMYFLNFNGIAAGGPVAGTKTSAGCTSGTSNAIINAVQTSQANP